MHKWWERLKGSICGVKPSIPALSGPIGGFVIDPADKASLKGIHFDSKQCQEQFSTPLSCLPQPRCNSLAFRTFVFLHLLLDLGTYRGVDPLDVFPQLLKKVSLNRFFRRLFRLGMFPEC